MLLSNSYAATKQDRRGAFLQEGMPSYLHCRRCKARRKLTPNRIPSPPTALVTLLSYLRTFPFSIRLDLSLSACVVCRSTICKIRADPRKFVGFKFTCNTSARGFLDFHPVARNVLVVFFSILQFSDLRILWRTQFLKSNEIKPYPSCCFFSCVT